MTRTTSGHAPQVATEADTEPLVPPPLPGSVGEAALEISSIGAPAPAPTVVAPTQPAAPVQAAPEWQYGAPPSRKKLAEAAQFVLLPETSQDHKTILVLLFDESRVKDLLAAVANPGGALAESPTVLKKRFSEQNQHMTRPRGDDHDEILLRVPTKLAAWQELQRANSAADAGEVGHAITKVVQAELARRLGLYLHALDDKCDDGTVTIAEQNDLADLKGRLWLPDFMVEREHAKRQNEQGVRFDVLTPLADKAVKDFEIRPGALLTSADKDLDRTLELLVRRICSNQLARWLERNRSRNSVEMERAENDIEAREDGPQKDKLALRYAWGLLFDEGQTWLRLQQKSLSVRVHDCGELRNAVRSHGIEVLRGAAESGILAEWVPNRNKAERRDLGWWSQAVKDAAETAVMSPDSDLRLWEFVWEAGPPPLLAVGKTILESEDDVRAPLKSAEDLEALTRNDLLLHFVRRIASKKQLVERMEYVLKEGGPRKTFRPESLLRIAQWVCGATGLVLGSTQLASPDRATLVADARGSNTFLDGLRAAIGDHSLLHWALFFGDDTLKKAAKVADGAGDKSWAPAVEFLWLIGAKSAILRTDAKSPRVFASLEELVKLADDSWAELDKSDLTPAIARWAELAKIGELSKKGTTFASLGDLLAALGDTTFRTLRGAPVFVNGTRIGGPHTEKKAVCGKLVAALEACGSIPGEVADAIESGALLAWLRRIDPARGTELEKGVEGVSTKAMRQQVALAKLGFVRIVAGGKLYRDPRELGDAGTEVIVDVRRLFDEGVLEGLCSLATQKELAEFRTKVLAAAASVAESGLQHRERVVGPVGAMELPKDSNVGDWLTVRDRATTVLSKLGAERQVVEVVGGNVGRFEPVDDLVLPVPIQKGNKAGLPTTIAVLVNSALVAVYDSDALGGFVPVPIPTWLGRRAGRQSVDVQIMCTGNSSMDSTAQVEFELCVAADELRQVAMSALAGGAVVGGTLAAVAGVAAFFSTDGSFGHGIGLFVMYGVAFGAGGATLRWLKS